jgi:phosphatidylglycerophosphatase A
MKTDADQRRVLLAHPAGWIASGFGAGLSPFAPGTAGSAVAVAAWLGLRELSWPAYALVMVATFALGVWVSAIVVRRLGISDPGVIVWDEFVGQWIALAPLLAWPRGAIWIFAGFVLFRVFDVWKPWPASWADRHVEGGFGVMLDDAFAGGWAALVLGIALMVS